MRYRILNRKEHLTLRQELSAGMDSGMLWIGSSREETACFTGHRLIAAKEQTTIASKLDQALADAYRQGKRCFISGGALGFDTMAAEAVLRLKSRYSDTKLVLALPCETQADRWSPKDRRHWEELKKSADICLVLSPWYYEGCMHVRNRFMVNHASLVICWFCHARGGTMATVSYAIRQSVPLLNLAENRSE